MFYKISNWLWATRFRMMLFGWIAIAIAIFVRHHLSGNDTMDRFDAAGFVMCVLLWSFAILILNPKRKRKEKIVITDFEAHLLTDIFPAEIHGKNIKIKCCCIPAGFTDYGYVLFSSIKTGKHIGYFALSAMMDKVVSGRIKPSDNIKPQQDYPMLICKPDIDLLVNISNESQLRCYYSGGAQPVRVSIEYEIL